MRILKLLQIQENWLSDGYLETESLIVTKKDEKKER